ncbi:MAG: DUF1848 domain-containing protein [Bryobacteraceae bacterium]
MIVSASCRTDIPAFYSEWFFRRLQAGFCTVRNPYSGHSYRVDLRREQVDGFVFWTRNFGPILRRLDELTAFGRPFSVQYTVTGYPRAIESAVIEPQRAIDQIGELAARVHPACPVWRYDPILFTSLTPPEVHLENFRDLAARMKGATDEVVISFAQMYAKTRRNLDAAAGRNGFQWIDPEPAQKLALAAQLTRVAREFGLQLTLCSQPEFVGDGALEARCVDARRLERMGGFRIAAAQKGTRPGCACHESRDIGDYDTCPHGCVYCYAVRHRRAALARYRSHDPAAESLLPVLP